MYLNDIDFDLNNDHPMIHELLKTATCIIVENSVELLAKLPSDIQVIYKKYMILCNYIYFLC